MVWLFPCLKEGLQSPEGEDFGSGRLPWRAWEAPLHCDLGPLSRGFLWSSRPGQGKAGHVQACLQTWCSGAVPEHLLWPPGVRRRLKRQPCLSPEWRSQEDWAGTQKVPQRRRLQQSRGGEQQEWGVELGLQCEWGSWRVIYTRRMSGDWLSPLWALSRERQALYWFILGQALASGASVL